MTIKQVWRPWDKGPAPFYVNGYDGASAAATAACLVDINGKRLLLRNGSGALWFRYESRNDTEWTYFFHDSADQNAFNFDKAWVERQFLSKLFGRVVPVPVTPDQDCEAFELLYFRSDGTGLMDPGRYEKSFSWDGLWEWPIDPISEAFELMSFLGRRIFDEWNSKQFNPRIDPATLEDQPLEFINGSRDELEQVTRWICHLGIGKPDGTTLWYIDYNAPDIRFNEAGGVSTWSFQGQGKLRELFNLAYEYNSFTGYHWEYNDNAVGYKESYDPAPISISFEIPLATQKERAEARAELVRWLNGKATAEEQQRLLGVSEVPQRRTKT